ncbi:NUDIX domain-containing protein [Piscinibacter sp.]|uniref:NUDIX domain-containing protein n=1 Tax=Piscinibacter sp. TaxID=1903157 RepID=UPI002B52D0DB|nr:NUDIX domain-containing protein [Albitalea sp.]HUG25724.1 NUDIX domain-containing protein [Albitalea sp.]
MAATVLSCGILVMDEQGELLLGHATGTAHWDIPKGCAEAGESEHQTAVRETREETGLSFAPEDLLDIGRFAYRRGKDLHLFAVLVPRIDTGRCACSVSFQDARGRTRPEMDGFAWVPFAQAPERCAKSLAALLTQTVSLPSVLDRLRGDRPRGAGAT